MLKCLTKYFLIIVGLWLSAGAHGQPVTGPAAVAGYSPAQKQLLVRSTATFTQFLNQQSLDKDTVMMIACRITGVPFLLAWAEDPDHTSFSPGAQWINTGNIAQAIRLFESVKGRSRSQPAIELATGTFTSLAHTSMIWIVRNILSALPWLEAPAIAASTTPF
jgi:two-component system, sensor histidine kinase PdtaS